MSGEIGKRLAEVQARIRAAAARSGRAPDAVRLVAVSKTVPVARIQEALAAGVTILGENRVQEARDKIRLLPGATWHLIGHLQTNKARLAVGLFALIHSLDSLRLAEELDRHGAQAGKTVRCLVEVNVGGEAQKSGLPAAEVPRLLAAARRLPALSIEGLMAIPPFHPDPEAVRPYFRALRELRERLARDGFALPELSMGMSHDFEAAVEEGATMVRVGTAIFGERNAEG
ncbi:MAG: YggS family pyridoxal phosphate-dependent enzyme [Candidatus Methylomirabilales bacterium]